MRDFRGMSSAISEAIALAERVRVFRAWLENFADFYPLEAWPKWASQAVLSNTHPKHNMRWKLFYLLASNGFYPPMLKEFFPRRWPQLDARAIDQIDRLTADAISGLLWRAGDVYFDMHTRDMRKPVWGSRAIRVTYDKKEKKWVPV